MERYSPNQRIDFTVYQIIQKLLHVVKMIVSSNKDFTRFLSYAEYQYLSIVNRFANTKIKDKILKSM